MTPGSASLVGCTLPCGYCMLSQLGRGGMGIVYEALQVSRGRRVAVKVLLELDARLLDRLREEARAAAAIVSPHVVQVTEMVEGSADHPAFVVMELLEGESLAALLRREGRLSTPRAIDVTRQLLAALAAAHRVNVVHRDVKPSNIFVVRRDWELQRLRRSRSVRARRRRCPRGALGLPRAPARRVPRERPGQH